MAKKLEVGGYMVKYDNGSGVKMLAWSCGLSLSRRDAIQKFKPRLRAGKTWKQAHRQGARVVWVTIKELCEV